MDMNENNEYLSHHGIKGQKWGLRRYQNQDGSLTAEGRRHRGLSDKPKEGGLKKLAKSVKEKNEVKKARSEAEKHEDLKKYVRDHPAKLYKHRFEFSDSEINTLVSQINTDSKLKDIRDAEVKRTWDKVKRAGENLGTVRNVASTMKDLYNLAAEVNNTMIDSGKMNGSKMTKIGQKPEAPKDTSYDEYKSWLKDKNIEMLKKAKDGTATKSEIMDWNTIYNNLNNIMGNNKNN